MSDSKAFSFVNVAGKTWFFNINASKNDPSKLYMTVVSKRPNGDTVKETFFPNQIPTYLHEMQTAYLEMCRRLGFQGTKTTQTERPVRPKPEPVVDNSQPVCPECGALPYKADPTIDRGVVVVNYDFSVGVECHRCGWMENFDHGTEKCGVWKEWVT